MTGAPRRTLGQSGASATFDRLSPRERQVLDGIGRGLTHKEIGLELGISHRTVEIHRARAARKLKFGPPPEPPATAPGD